MDLLLAMFERSTFKPGTVTRMQALCAAALSDITLQERGSTCSPFVQYQTPPVDVCLQSSTVMTGSLQIRQSKVLTWPKPAQLPPLKC